MLNRRTIRVKAMQSIYAFEQCKEANYHLALELVKTTFQPDLNSMEIQNKPLLKTLEKEAASLFQTYYSQPGLPAEKSDNVDVQQVVNDAIKGYHKQVIKDRKFLRQTMLKDADAIVDRFAWLMVLPCKLKDIIANERVREDVPSFDNFTSNKIVGALQNHSGLKSMLKKSGLSWSVHIEELKIWIRQIMFKDDEFINYLNLQSPGIDKDQSIILYIFKNIIFKNEMVDQFMEKLDLYWSENEAILKSMVLKTVKSIKSDDITFELAELSYNWEDDKVFFDTIYEKTLENEKEYEELIAKKAKNWDIDRIADTDKILLKMAIQEMINFPAIPVKVTINEYIEISKRYSTPKSKHFVNGVLDVIAVDLQKSGKIKKSGRGLIDNK